MASPMRKGVTYAQLVEKLAAMGIDEKEVNVRNKPSRGKFTAAFMLQCLSAIGCSSLQFALAFAYRLMPKTVGPRPKTSIAKAQGSRALKDSP